MQQLVSYKMQGIAQGCCDIAGVPILASNRTAAVAAQVTLTALSTIMQQAVVGCESNYDHRRHH